MDSATTTMALTHLCDKGFRAFPPEVREMTFKSNLADSWNGKTPALIQALRGSELHLEALDALAKTNTFKLHEGNEWSLEGMGIAAIRSLCSLEIDIKDGQEAAAIDFLVNRKGLLMFDNLKDLIVRTDSTPIGFTGTFEPAVSNAFKGLRNYMELFRYLKHSKTPLRRIKLVTAGCPCPFEGLNLTLAYVDEIDWRFEMVNWYIVKSANSILQHGAVLAQVSSSTTQEWVWNLGDMTRRRERRRLEGAQGTGNGQNSQMH